MASSIPENQRAITLEYEGSTFEMQLSDNDPIFATSFRSMIQEAFEEGKHFFVAVIQARQDLSTEIDGVYSHVHCHYFSAYGVLKLLFKKKGNDCFVGRYHDKFPISAKNPVTNAVS